jgi:hypothetical protein
MYPHSKASKTMSFGCFKSCWLQCSLALRHRLCYYLLVQNAIYFYHLYCVWFSSSCPSLSGRDQTSLIYIYQQHTFYLTSCSLMAALLKQISKRLAVAVMPSADLSRWVDLCCSVIIFEPALDFCSLLLELAPDVGLTHSPAPVVCCGSREVHTCSVVQPHDVLHAPAVTVIILCRLHAAMTTGNVAHFLKGSKPVKFLDVVLCILVSLIVTGLLTRVSNLILRKIFIHHLCDVSMRWSVHSR